MENALIAIVRKLIFAVFVVGGLILFDKFYLTGFNTWEAIKDDPKAIAILLGLLALSISLS